MVVIDAASFSWTGLDTVKEIVESRKRAKEIGKRSLGATPPKTKASMCSLWDDVKMVTKDLSVFERARFVVVALTPFVFGGDNATPNSATASM